MSKPVVTTKVKGAAIRITWTASPGASSYRVYRSYSLKGTKTLIKKTDDLSYSDYRVKSGKKAYYFVRAYKSSTHSYYSAASSCKVIRVYIETGHGTDSKGKWDSGCKWNGYQEAKLMIPIAKAMTDYMRKSGVYVYTDAYSGNNRNLVWTLNYLKSHNVSAFVNIHCDYSKAKSGTLPLYRTSAQKTLARALNKGVHSEISIRDRGLKYRTDLDTLNTSSIGTTACIFETGAIKADNVLLRTKYRSYGRGMAKGLCNYLGIEFVE